MGVLGDRAPREILDRARTADVERHRRHVLAPRDRAIERFLPPAGDDHRVAEIVETLRERFADARSAAGDEDGVAGLFHGGAPAERWCRGDLGVAAPHERRRRQNSRSEEHTSELQSLMRISYAVFCLKKKKNNTY